MNLLELTEPLFQYICRINRAGRNNASLDYVQVRSDVEGLFEEMRMRAGGDFKLTKQYEEVELPLIFFVDSMITESNLRCAREWDKNRLAYQRKELAGDE